MFWTCIGVGFCNPVYNEFIMLQGRPGRQGPQGAAGEKGSRVSEYAPAMTKFVGFSHL